MMTSRGMKKVSEFGNRLRELRKKIPFKPTMEEVGEAIGVAKNTYANYENGKRKPNLKMLKKLSDYYEVSLDYLIKGIEVEDSLNITISYLEKVGKEELASNKKLRKAILKATKKIIDNELSDKN